MDIRNIYIFLNIGLNVASCAADVVKKACEMRTKPGVDRAQVYKAHTPIPVLQK